MGLVVVRLLSGYRRHHGSGIRLAHIDSTSNTVTATVPVARQPENVAVSRDGSKVYVTTLGGGTVEVISTATNTKVDSIRVGDSAHDVAVSPDGNTVYVSGSTGTSNHITVIRSDGTMTVFTTGGYVGDIEVSPDGSRIYAANPVTDDVYVFDAGTYQFIEAITVPPVNGKAVTVTEIAVSPSGSTVYGAGSVTGNTGAVTVIDTSNGSVTDQVAGSSRQFGLALSADGQTLYVVNCDAGTMTIYG